MDFFKGCWQSVLRTATAHWQQDSGIWFPLKDMFQFSILFHVRGFVQWRRGRNSEEQITIISASPPATQNNINHHCPVANSSIYTQFISYCTSNKTSQVNLSAFSFLLDCSYNFYWLYLQPATSTLYLILLSLSLSSSFLLLLSVNIIIIIIIIIISSSSSSSSSSSLREEY